MAALTATTSSTRVAGNRKVVTAVLPAVSDADTFDTGLSQIDSGSVQITHNSASTVAADSIAVDSISGGVITFQVAGTARIADVMAVGY